MKSKPESSVTEANTQRFLRNWLLVLICSLPLAYAGAQQTAAKSADTQLHAQRISSILSNPVMMNRIYRHFFAYQHYLDGVADQQEVAGKSAGELRHIFQKRLGFSDTEYKPIRTSCDHFATNLKSLQDEIKANPKEKSGFAEVRNLSVNAEIESLTNSMSAKNKTAFETLLVSMFAPRQELQKGVEQ